MVVVVVVFPGFSTRASTMREREREPLGASLVAGSGPALFVAVACPALFVAGFCLAVSLQRSWWLPSLVCWFVCAAVAMLSLVAPVCGSLLAVRSPVPYHSPR